MTRFAVALLALALTACGQKGSLYLPKPSAQPAPAATKPAEPNDDERQAPAATPSEQVR